LNHLFIFIEPVNLPARSPKSDGRDIAEETPSPNEEDAGREVDPILKTAMEMFGGEISGKNDRRPRAR